ncbi:MAG: C1A family cysteine protease, partial [Bacillariaceae sp.]
EKYADLTPKEFVKVVGCANNNNNDDGSNEIERESNTSTSTNAYTSDNAHYHLRAQHQQQKHQKQEAFLRSRHLISNTVSELNINNNNGDKKGDNSNSTKTNINNSNFNNTAISSSSAPITIMYIDWRNNNGVSYVTPPKNQGPYGSCWSFSAAENLEGLQVRQGYTLQNISEQEFISCCPQCRGRGTWQTFDWLINTTNGYPALEEY